MYLDVIYSKLLIISQNRRGPVLRSSPATSRHRLALREARELGCRRRYSGLRSAAPFEGRPRRLWRRSMSLPGRRLHQSRDQAGCCNQGPDTQLDASFPGRRTDEEKVHRGSDCVRLFKIVPSLLVEADFIADGRPNSESSLLVIRSYITLLAACMQKVGSCFKLALDHAKITYRGRTLRCRKTSDTGHKRLSSCPCPTGV